MPHWLEEGTPAGITRPIEACHIFPEHDPAEPGPHELLCTDFESFANYKGVDEDGTAAEEISKHIALGRLKEYASPQAMEQDLGQPPVLNKIGIITRLKDGVAKKWMFLDTQASAVKEATERGQRVLLPRLLNAVFHIFV